MAFARKVWKLLVAIKDGLVLLLLLLFFGALYAVLTFRPVAAVVEDGALLVALDGVVVEEPAPTDPFAMVLSTSTPIQEHRARDVVRAIEGAATDERIKAVVLDLDYFLGGGQVHMEEIGKAIDKVRAADKPVLTHAIAYTGDSMQLAAHASEIWVDPLGGAPVAGPGGTYLFFGQIAERLKINVHVYRTGEYKSAVEPYTRSGFSDAARSDIEGTYGNLWENWLDGVSRARPQAQVRQVAMDPVASIRAANGNGAQAAVNTGLADRIGSYEDFSLRVAELVGNDPSLPDEPRSFAHTSYRDWVEAVAPPLDGRAIGVVTVAGSIVDGEAGPGTAGGDRIAALLDEALQDDLAALVVRVDSPGGSVTASERIRQAILRHKARGIPVVVSMANVAASGGYYVATPGDAIFADPSTITGSIGVFLAVPSAENALPEWGVTTDSIRTSPLAGQPDLLGGFTPEMDAILQAQVEHSYDLFLGLVSESRNISRARLRSDIAGGRIWAGGPARQVGLVDRYGNLNEALAHAAQLAGLGAGDWHARFLQDEPDPFTAFLQSMTAPEEAVEEGDMLAVMMARRDLAAGRSLADLAELLDRPRIQARCVGCPPPVSGATEDASPAVLRVLLDRVGL
ncbi:signal peptide peptidase SppA [Croceicoccus marinus]|jgi:protease-4|uniref:Signal peptide peptidase SppA n=1 Tax=Croceicoccus marinus TaxID=450378 RepID=A0A7G6VTF9_9SPHN|nr:signal peptide peptidase SppA [Croceicoccus marinus]QNE05024.1 signal peptide peptidase SppA [Croceicoccus marinus]